MRAPSGLNEGELSKSSVDLFQPAALIVVGPEWLQLPVEGPECVQGPDIEERGEPGRDSGGATLRDHVMALLPSAHRDERIGLLR